VRLLEKQLREKTVANLRQRLESLGAAPMLRVDPDIGISDNLITPAA
jgi:hypothetical protein